MKGATTIQERLWDLRKDKGLNLEELARLTQIFMGCPLIICYAGQKTGSRPTRL